jgi:hypothetical protein
MEFFSSGWNIIMKRAEQLVSKFPSRPAGPSCLVGSGGQERADTPLVTVNMGPAQIKIDEALALIDWPFI